MARKLLKQFLFSRKTGAGTYHEIITVSRWVTQGSAEPTQQELSHYPNQNAHSISHQHCPCWVETDVGEYYDQGQMRDVAGAQFLSSFLQRSRSVSSSLWLIGSFRLPELKTSPSSCRLFPLTKSGLRFYYYFRRNVVEVGKIERSF